MTIMTFVDKISILEEFLRRVHVSRIKEFRTFCHRIGIVKYTLFYLV